MPVSSTLQFSLHFFAQSCYIDTYIFYDDGTDDNEKWKWITLLQNRLQLQCNVKIDRDHDHEWSDWWSSKLTHIY